MLCAKPLVPICVTDVLCSCNILHQGGRQSKIYVEGANDGGAEGAKAPMGKGPHSAPRFGGPDAIPPETIEILHANLCILLLFGVICLGQKYKAKILEGRKYSLLLGAPTSPPAGIAPLRRSVFTCVEWQVTLCDPIMASDVP